MTAWQLALLGVVCLTAGAAQTVAGFGLSLIVAPIAQTITPGAVAVRLMVGLAAIVNSGILARSWRQVLPGPAALIIAPTLVATLVVGPIISGSGSDVIGIVAAGATLLTVAVTAVGRTPRQLSGRTGAVVAGAVSGALNVSSGVSGPPVAAYAAAQSWPADRLVPTVQAVFLPGNIAAFLVLGGARIPLGLGLVGALGTIVGMGVGAWARPRIPPGVVRKLILTVATIGAVLVLVRSVA